MPRQATRRFPEHRDRKVNTCHMAIRGVQNRVDTRSHPDLKHLVTLLNTKSAD